VVGIGEASDLADRTVTLGLGKPSVKLPTLHHLAQTAQGFQLTSRDPA